MAANDLEDDDSEAGEYVDLGLDEDDVEDTEDGGAIVKLDESPKRGESNFYANLAEDLSESELSKLATDFTDLIERDREARKKRDEQYEMGLRRTGLGDDAPGGATFQGASKVVHPVLTEVCVDFASRAMKELWPADGPAKSKIVGESTEERVAKADRKSDFMNWQLTVQATEARAEMEQLLTQVPLGGAQYLKVTWDEQRNRPCFLFIAIDDIYLPYAATNFYTAQRKTHVQYVTRQEYEARVRKGMYRDIDMIVAPSMTPEVSSAETANDKIEGRESSAYNEDGLRTVYEIYATAMIDGDEETDAPAPYIITVDKTSNKVLCIYRNWDEDDATQEEFQWIVEFPFVPWRGAYPIGMIHMIGGLAGAATGALRALLDAAHIANSQTMLKLKGGVGGQTLNIEPAQILEIEGSMMADDIRKLAMPLPYNQPSATLFSLLGFLVDAAKGVVRTTLDTTVDSNENTPVGTTLARIEQGMTVFSAIHGRLHDAMGRMLRIQHRLNAMYLDDPEEKDEAGSLLASRADFDGPMDVVPVSDPNIFSEAQRFAQVQAIAQRAQLRPDLYDGRKVEELILNTLKIPAPASYLIPKQTPTEENAVSENVKATLGRPIVAFPDQDHIAHMKTHLAYMTSPVLGASQLMAPVFLPIIVGHIKEHIALWYAAEVFKTASDVTDEPLSELLVQTHKSKDKEDKQVLDQMIAEASLNVVQEATEALAALPPVIGQAIQMIQQLTPPQPQDPAAMVAMEDVKMRGQVAAQKAQLEGQKLQQRAQDDAHAMQMTHAEAQQAAAQAAQDAELERERLAAEDRRAALDIQARVAMNDADNEVAVLLAEMGDASVSQNPNPNP